jgi:DNA-binding MarR family transcriptional regulator
MTTATGQPGRRSQRWPGHRVDTGQVSRSLQEVGLAIKRVQVRHHRALDSQLASLGISLVQWDALRHLNTHPDASLHDLAQLTFQSDQAFGTLAARMADRGLIERVPGPGRAIRHRITGKGHDLLDKGSHIVDNVFTATLGTLTPRQLDTLGQLLEHILDAEPPAEK